MTTFGVKAPEARQRPIMSRQPMCRPYRVTVVSAAQIRAAVMVAVPGANPAVMARARPPPRRPQTVTRAR